MHPDDHDKQDERQPYAPPAIEETGTFERLVLACNKIQDVSPVSEGFCPVPPLSS